MKKYNNDIMEAIRQRMGLDENDISEDDEIMKSKRLIFDRCQNKNAPVIFGN